MPPEQISERLFLHSKTETCFFANWPLTQKKFEKKQQSCLKIVTVNIILFSNAEL